MIYLKTYEIFDSGNISNITVIINKQDEFKTTFNVDGSEYFFHARDETKVEPKDIRYGWHVSFGKTGKNKYLKTKLGNQYKVMPLVKKSIELFVKDYKPNKISYIAEGDKKIAIYTELFNLSDWKMDKVHSGLDSYSGEIPWLVKYVAPEK